MLASTSVAVLLLVLRVQSSAAYSDPWKFLIVSDARNGSIAYMAVPPSGPKENMSLQTLVPRSSTLVHPQGLAVDQYNSRLLVADPDLKRVVCYTLKSKDGSLTADAQTTVAEEVEARWVTFDSLGNVYFSSEADNKILKVEAKNFLAGNTTSQVVYDASHGLLSAPGGVITDNFNLYWTNKLSGDTAGVIVGGPVVKEPAENTPTTALAKNIEKAYGLCMAKNDIYYTAPEQSLFATPRTGGEIVEVSSAFTNPRGCAWDGDSTMYIADRGSGAIYSFNAPQENLQEVQLQQVATFADAFGLAIFSLAPRPRAVCALALSLLGLLMAKAVHDL